MADNEVKMMMSVYPGAMTGFAALNAGLVSINNIFGNMTRAFDQQFDLLDTAITTTGVVVTQLGVDAMNAFGEFEQGMKIVQMVSGQTAQDIGYLSQKASEFSVQYRTDIDQITEGLQTLGRAGLNSATEQAEVLQNGLNTAKLEGRDLNSVLEELIQNTALLGGNLKSANFGEESEYVNDLLVATSMTAPITTHDVSETLKYSGGIAAAAGANIESESGKAILEDYMGSIAAFAQKGVTGSIAGTALRAFFNKPATQDSSVKEALASIKLKPEYLWEDDEEVMKPVSEQIKLIQDQMDDLNVSTMDRLQIWSKIVGGKMGQQMMKLDSSDIKELTKDIRAADDASDLAAGSMKTYQANVKALGESGAALQRDVGEKLVYFANPILEFMNKFTSFLDNDISSTVFATSIIAFVGMLGRKIFDVIKIIKGELSTLMSGIKYHIGKPGLAIGPDGKPISTDSSGGGQKSPKNAMEFARQYYGFSKGAELESLKKAGMSDADIARVGMFSTLKKDSTGAGILDAEFVKRIYPSLSAAQKSQMDSLIRAAGGASRKPFDQMFLDEDKVLKEEYRDLAIKMGLFEESTKQATSALDAMKATFGNKTGSKSSDWQKQYAQDTEAYVKNQQAQAAQAAQAHATALGNETNAEEETVIIVEDATSQIKTAWHSACTMVIKDVEAMKEILSTTMTGTSKNSRSPWGAGAVGLLDYRDYLRLKAMELYGPEFENVPKTPEKNKKVERGPTQPQYPEKGDPQAEYYNRLGKTADRKESAGKYGDHVLTEAERQAAAKKMGVGIYGTGLSGKEKEALEAEKQAELSKVQYLEQEVVLEGEKLEIIQESLIAERQKADAVKGWNSTYEARKKAEADAELRAQERKKTAERLGVKKVPDNYAESTAEKEARERGSGGVKNALITDRKEIEDIQKRSRQEYLRNQQARLKEKYGNSVDYRGQNLSQVSEVTRSEINAALSKYGNLYGQNSLSGVNAALTEQRAIGNKILSENQSILNRLPPMHAMGYGNLVGSPDFVSSKGKTFGQTFMKSASDYLNRDRSGRLLNFASLGANGKFANSLGGLANKALNLSDAFGGPLMIAIMAVTTAIQMWQQAFQDYCEDLKEAGNKLKDAYSEWESAEDSLRQTYQKGNPDASSEEINDMVLETYSTMNNDMVNAWNNGEQEWFKKINKQGITSDNYVLDEESDDGSTKVEEKEEISDEQAYQDAIKENTGALYRATAELSVAMSNYTRKMEDSWWGLDGWTGNVTNALGSFQDNIEKNGIFGPSAEDWNNPFSNRLGSRYSDNNEFLLTAQQKDENYSGYTEMAGLMLEDIKDANGNWIKGMRTMMGEDVEIINDVMSQGAKDFLKNTGQNFIGKLTPNQNATLQASMKNNTKTWKSLGKEIAKYEMKNQKSVGKDAKQSTKRIEGLINKLNTSMGSKFSRTQILQAAYLMEMQEMYQVAQNTMVPLIQQNADSVANTLLTTQGIGEQTNGTGSYTSSTAAIASSIAAMVSVIAMAKSGEAYYNQLNMSDPTKLSPEEKAAYELAQESDNAQDFMKKAGAMAYKKSYEWDFTGNLDTTGPIPGFMSKKDAEAQNAKNQAAMAGILKNYMATAKMTVFGYDEMKAINDADAYVSNALKNGASPMDLYKTIAKNYQSPEFLNKLVGAYLASGDEGDSSGGSGGGSGSGSGDKDSNTGTRRERVDLVLCNKKEIPKLNVNLFKKPPSFTILNKNFKLRDVKINSEDKPKAIMAAIKNSFIDIQKRTDPKIIQDEDAVYDPAAATDGTNVPSGTAKTKTDNN